MFNQSRRLKVNQYCADTCSLLNPECFIIREQFVMQEDTDAM